MSTQMAAAAAPCKDCGGTEWKAIEVDGVRRTTRCDCWRNKNPTRSHAENVPRYFERTLLADVKPLRGNRVALEAAREWLDGKRHDLYFLGEVGRGKTMLACALLNECFLGGENRPPMRSAFFIRVPYWLDLQLKGFDDPVKRAEANAIWDRCVEADPLCLDDVAGGEKPSDYSRRQLVTLYDRRLDLGKRTIWTSNLSLADLSEFYGDDRLPSRISGAAGEVLAFTNDDIRMDVRTYGDR